MKYPIGTIVSIKGEDLEGIIKDYFKGDYLVVLLDPDGNLRTWFYSPEDLYLVSGSSYKSFDEYCMESLSNLF